MGPEQLLLAAELSENAVIDDRLRLIFICCHPALNNEAQVALTLRTLGGLSTSAIARAFLVSEATMAQRLVRAKAKIRDACIPYTVPSRKDLHERLRSVLQVIYLIFNEGYGEDIREGVRQSMTIEAIRLGRLLLELLPGECEVHGLLALMLLHQARASARFDTSGDLILLQQQDRTLWDAALITEGIAVTKESLRSGLNAYGIQAAIAAVHAEACQASDTDWAQIEALYGVLGNIEPSPIVELNRAVAIAMQDKTSEAASLVASLDGLDDYSPYWATKAYLLARTARTREASLAYRRAADLAPPGAQKRYLERRSAELHNPAG